MNLSNLLKKVMYKDKATVRRAVSTKMGKTDDLTTDFVTVYEDMPCRISQSHERATFHRDDVSQKDTLNYMLYHPPEYDVLENDVIEISHSYDPLNFIYLNDIDNLNDVDKPNDTDINDANTNTNTNTNTNEVDDSDAQKYQAFKLFAGVSFKYVSHTELQLKRRREARQ